MRQCCCRTGLMPLLVVCKLHVPAVATCRLWCGNISPSLQEQVSEAVLLHAMVAQLEQTLADPAALEADLQAGAEQAAAALLGVQLQGAGADGIGLERPAHPGPGETASVIQPQVLPLGDPAAARLAGLTTGNPAAAQTFTHPMPESWPVHLPSCSHLAPNPWHGAAACMSGLSSTESDSLVS